MITTDMPLLNEGTDVWVQAAVEDIGRGHYRVLGPMPEAQHWRFSPGTIVQLRASYTLIGKTIVEAVEIANEG